MPDRLLNARRARCAVILAALLPSLTDCGPARNQFAPPCPRQAILGDAADFEVHRSGTRDLTDLVLHGRIVGMQGTCQQGQKKDQLAVTVSLAVELTRGPAMAGRDTDVPVFLAVTRGDTIVDKRGYLMHVSFPSNVDRITMTPGEVNLVLPVTPTRSGAAYTLVAGFQLTPGQMTEERRSP